MRLAYKMEYIYPTDNQTDIVLVKYSSEYKEDYKTIYNESYHEMREALDIKPYDFIQDDTFFEEGIEVLIYGKNKVQYLVCGDSDDFAEKVIDGVTIDIMM